MINMTTFIARHAEADPDPRTRLANLLSNQNGSVIVLTLMILVVMSVIGLVASRTVVTENFIIRNVGIHQENLNLVDAALMEGLQRFMQVPDDDPANFDPNTSNTDWINDRNSAWTTANWYQAGIVGQLLDANNSMDCNTPAALANRGENANGNLHYAVVGWEPVKWGSGGSESLVVGGKPVWHGGRIIGEYLSTDGGGNDNRFGMMRMELGVRRQW